MRAAKPITEKHDNERVCVRARVHTMEMSTSGCLCGNQNSYIYSMTNTRIIVRTENAERLNVSRNVDIQMGTIEHVL